MNSYSHRHSPTRRRFRNAACGAVLASAGFTAAACLDRPLCSVKVADQTHLVEDCRPATTNMFVDTGPGAPVTKLDLLFMIDNSSSMADKQNVLKDAVPDLVDRFVNPVCVGPGGARATANAPDDKCPDGMRREFQPVKDIHVGVITSSLGGHGSPACVPDPSNMSPDQQEEQNDHAHLIATRPRGLTAVTAAGGYPPDKLGFLYWNPKQNDETVEAFKASFEAMVPAAGDEGCGLEAQLESVYRFLSDPSPPADIVTGPCANNPTAKCAMPSGVDQEILAQRKAFLRPDSLVAVIMLTDENDCSIRDSDQYFVIGDPNFDPFPTASVCGTNPNDPCCYACALGPPKGCAPDPACSAPPAKRPPDEMNLRCFDQKRRFGLDFLYPTARYVNALTKAQICVTRADLAGDPSQCPAQKDGKPGLVENPLFSDLTGSGAPARPASLVFFAGILGVPWQAIQKTVDDSGNPIPAGELRYKLASEMATDGTWDRILGQPHPENGAPPVPPSDPHMVESPAPRPGIEGPNAAYLADAVNGHEWSIPRVDDLEYACIFELPKPNDCSTNKDCDCNGKQPGQNNPLCQAADGSYGTTQYFAKGYPGTRELEVLKGVGENAIVASICARDPNVANKNAPDYGYRPAVSAIVDALKVQIGGKCLPRELKRVDGEYPCSILEASANPADGDCAARPGRSKPNAGLIEPARERLRADHGCDDDPATPLADCNAVTFCEIKEAGPTCLEDTEEQTDVGWCYVDPANGEGDESLVANCPDNGKRILRFVDPNRNTPVHGGTVLIACIGADLTVQ